MSGGPATWSHKTIGHTLYSRYLYGALGLNTDSIDVINWVTVHAGPCDTPFHRYWSERFENVFIFCYLLMIIKVTDFSTKGPSIKYVTLERGRYPRRCDSLCQRGGPKARQAFKEFLYIQNLKLKVRFSFML